ncbi:MAG TPA: hypothetical protein VKT22_11315 [Steroidobacteraceae bacterium]|nr:hypothetical protein [Steroidobacteraceae bacterium]
MRGACVLLLLAGLGPMSAAGADRLDVTGELDLRWVDSDASRSFLEGGLGALRYDSEHQGVRLGRAMLAPRLRLTDILTLHAVIVDYGDGSDNGVNMSELYLDLRPFPTSPVRWRVRTGAFFLPVSLENRGVGWSDVYTITPSALNTWIGDELRTIGTEVEARWLGASRNYDGDVSAVAGVYGWDDGAGAVLAERGFALTDRPSALFGGIGRPPYQPYREIDHRPGVYGGLSWRHHAWLEVRSLYYDNRADPAVYSGTRDYAWHTRFMSEGVRVEPTAHVTFIAQYLDGDTAVGPGEAFRMPFHALFGLVSFEWGRERLTVRLDDFATHQTRGDFGPPSSGVGHAWTAGFTHRLGEHWQIAAEWIHLTSRFAPRIEYGPAVTPSESQTQVALRYRFHAIL